MTVTHTDMTTNEFANTVLGWTKSARHPRFNRPYTELVYRPMLELLAYLRAKGFKTFIVSGGGVEFMRPWVEKIYGISPAQVVGSSGVVKFQIGVDGKPVLMKLAKIEFIDDGPGKPVDVNRFIGRRPIFAFGNSDGDLQMRQWTVAGGGARFAGIVHHTDSERAPPPATVHCRICRSPSELPKAKIGCRPMKRLMPTGLPGPSSMNSILESSSATACRRRRSGISRHPMSRPPAPADAVDLLHPRPHEFDAAAGHDKGLEAIGAQVSQQLQHRLVDEFGVGPVEARMPRRCDPVEHGLGEFVRGHAGVGRRHDLKQALFAAAASAFMSLSSIALNGCVVFHSGCCGAIALTRSKANAT